MTLAQSANTIAASNPNYVLHGAIIAGTVALIVAVFGNFWANGREYDKWRREELTKQIFAVQDILTEIKGSINNNTFQPQIAGQRLYDMAENTFRIRLLVEDKFEKQFIEIVNAITEIIQSGQYAGQDLRRQITDQQGILTKQAQKELKRKTPGPFKFMLGIVLLVIFLPLLLLAMILRWKHIVKYIKDKPAMVRFRRDWRTYRNAEKRHNAMSKKDAK